MPYVDSLHQAAHQLRIVTQFHHPRELTPDGIAAIEALGRVGCILRNQTVLRKGVNDHAYVLARRNTPVGYAEGPGIRAASFVISACQANSVPSQ